ncbi:hypothetical protein TNCV_5025561 [Trichonephila clavipes]|nr:hypothetical protein TNCV_5025561 [Trichonephila clavipes]
MAAEKLCPITRVHEWESFSIISYGTFEKEMNSCSSTSQRMKHGAILDPRNQGYFNAVEAFQFMSSKTMLRWSRLFNNYSHRGAPTSTGVVSSN